MKKIILTIVLATLCLFFKVGAQSQINDIKPLKIGERIPNWVWNLDMPVLTNQGSTTDSLRLNDYQGKLIILDFWASWCSTCIYKFGEIERFQKQFDKVLKAILVNTKNTKDTPARMNGVLTGKKAPFISSILPTVYNDTILDQLFPHSYLPHYIWINGKGVLKAISGSELLTEATIIDLLKEEGVINAKKNN